jgi:hypothetical protein
MMALTDHQLKTVQQAASMLPLHARDSFLRSVANRLSPHAAPTDADIARAVSFVLNCRGVAVGHAHPVKEKPHAFR